VKIVIFGNNCGVVDYVCLLFYSNWLYMSVICSIDEGYVGRFRYVSRLDIECVYIEVNNVY
jgi:hypothetical protein